MEDYCFCYFYLIEYKWIVKLLYEWCFDCEYYIEEFVGYLCVEMKVEGVKVEVYGCLKYIYSIWCKM